MYPLFVAVSVTWDFGIIVLLKVAPFRTQMFGLSLLSQAWTRVLPLRESAPPMFVARIALSLTRRVGLEARYDAQCPSLALKIVAWTKFLSSVVTSGTHSPTFTSYLDI